MREYTIPFFEISKLWDIWAKFTKHNEVVAIAEGAMSILTEAWAASNYFGSACDSL
jgi:hypothetical protein